MVYPSTNDYFISRNFISIRYQKLRNAGSDLGAAVKALKAMSDDEPKKMRSLLKLKTVQPPAEKLKL